jgi:hypothetical protein
VVELKIFARWRCGSVKLLEKVLAGWHSHRISEAGALGQADWLLGGPDAQLLFESKTINWASDGRIISGRDFASRRHLAGT